MSERLADKRRADGTPMRRGPRPLSLHLTAGAGQLAQLRGRIAALEERLAALESGAEGAGGGPCGTTCCRPTGCPAAATA